MKEENALAIAGEQIEYAESGHEMFEVGKIIGQIQTLGFIGAQCSGGQAELLKRIKASGAHKNLNQTWDRFCEERIGMSRPTADRIIADFDEFGIRYFSMKQVVQISAARYRLVAGSVSEAGIEIEGETVAFTKANAARIREAIDSIEKDKARVQDQLSDTKGELEKTRADRDNARTAAKNYESTLKTERANTANRWKTARPAERLLIDAEEAIRYAAKCVRNAKAHDDFTAEDAELAREFGFGAIRALEEVFAISSMDIAHHEMTPAGRSPIAERTAKDLEGTGLKLAEAPKSGK